MKQLMFLLAVLLSIGVMKVNVAAEASKPVFGFQEKNLNEVFEIYEGVDKKPLRPQGRQVGFVVESFALFPPVVKRSVSAGSRLGVPVTLDGSAKQFEKGSEHSRQAGFRAYPKNKLTL